MSHSLPSVPDEDDEDELERYNADGNYDYPPLTSIAVLGSGFDPVKVGPEFVLTHPGPASLEFVRKAIKRNKSLFWATELVLVLNDYLIRYGMGGNRNGWFFLSRVGLGSIPYILESRWKAGPHIFFVPCNPSQEDKNRWLEGDLFAKIELSCVYGITSMVNDLSAALPIWVVGPRVACNKPGNKILPMSVRVVDQWIFRDISTMKEGNTMENIAKNQEEKIQGLSVDLFKIPGGHELFCADAGDLGSRATVYAIDKSARGETNRRVNYTAHQPWVSEHVMDYEDPILAMLRTAWVAATTVDKQGAVQCVSYREARLWGCRAPLKLTGRDVRPKIPWSDAEHATLSAHWKTADRDEMMELLPGRTRGAIGTKALELGL